MTAPDGKILWDVPVLKQETLRKEGKNSWATPTPVTDGQHVYASFGGGVAAVTFDGKVAWTNTEYPFYSRHGLAASPVLYKDLLILSFDGSNKVPDNGGKPPPEEYIGWQKPWDRGFVVALDTKTGKTRWRSMRGLMTRIAHVTPMVIDVDGMPQLVSPAGDYVEAFDPDTGKPLWWVRSDGETPVPSVVYGDGLVFTTSGFPTNSPSGPWIRAIRPGKKGELGDLTATHVAWESRRNVPMMPSFLFVGNGPESDHLLVWTHYDGVATCVEPKTGKQIWQQRLDRQVLRVAHLRRRQDLLPERGRQDDDPGGGEGVQGRRREHDQHQRALPGVPGVLQRADLPPLGQAPVCIK